MVLLCCLGAPLVLSSCDNAISETSYLPWFASYSQKRIDLSKILSVDDAPYEVQARSLSRIDPSDPTRVQTYKLFFVDRGTQQNSTLIAFDADMNILKVVKARGIAGPRHWFIDPRGFLELGDIEIALPAAANAAWPDAAAAPAAVPMGSQSEDYVAIGAFLYGVNPVLDTSTGDLRLGSSPPTPQTELDTYDSSAAYARVGSLAAPVLIAGFLNQYVAQLIPGQVYDPALSYYVSLAGRSVDYDNSLAPVLDIVCTLSVQGGVGQQKSSGYFVVSIPLKPLETILPSDVTLVSLSLGKPIDTGEPRLGAWFPDTVHSIVARVGTGFVFSTSSYYQNSSRQSVVPQYFASPMGNFVARLDAATTRNPASGQATTEWSAAGLTPLYLDGLDSWLAYDGNGLQLYLCRGWWVYP